MEMMSPHVYDEIRSLLAAPRNGSEAPPLAQLEETLTSGYAHALALEAERWRLERRIGEIAAALDEGSSEDGAAELTELSSRLSQADGELSRLRGLLVRLRTRASDLRLAEAGA
jgi:ABC-type phosphate transport system auxiliary subunit